MQQLLSERIDVKMNLPPSPNIFLSIYSKLLLKIIKYIDISGLPFSLTCEIVSDEEEQPSGETGSNSLVAQWPYPAPLQISVLECWQNKDGKFHHWVSLLVPMSSCIQTSGVMFPQLWFQNAILSKWFCNVNQEWVPERLGLVVNNIGTAKRQNASNK